MGELPSRREPRAASESARCWFGRFASSCPPVDHPSAAGELVGDDTALDDPVLVLVDGDELRIVAGAVDDGAACEDLAFPVGEAGQEERGDSECRQREAFHQCRPLPVPSAAMTTTTRRMKMSGLTAKPPTTIATARSTSRSRSRTIS